MPPGRKAPVPVPRSVGTGETDLSLSTLISSVERDILMLEQMERTGSALGHLPSLPSLPSSPSPTPPLTSTLLSLPGYRPRPPLPSSPSVVNPGYDALLCRRLNRTPPSTPPPPIPAKLGHRRRNSDSLLSSSITSIPSSPGPGTPHGSPGEAVMAERVIRHAAIAPRQHVFCPFCVAHFYQQQELQEHLISHHSEELHLLRQEQLAGFRAETCPCCQAQFLKAGLGPRHLVHHHPEFVCALLLGSLPPASGRPPPLPGTVPSTPPPDRHAFCLLCGQRFLRKHVKLLALHLQQQHPQQFSAAVASHCSMSTEPIVDLETNPTSPPHHYEEVDASPEGRPAAYLQVLPEPLELRQAQESKRQRREARRAGMREERDKVEREGRRMQTPQRSQHTRSFKRAGWRAGQETYQGIAQPEPPPLPITGHGSESHLAEEAMETSYSKAVEKENYLHYSSAHLLFRCNLCGERYAANEDLLAHLKQEHMAVSRVLKPQYSCARCPANFFKNAFLLKHSLTHTQSKQNL